ncbi:nitric oxide synthase, brain-like isoform X2 [Gigantopelta aegis]|nr:nitric oxide synthase, brain-like isoform X2 [Gigantopelta aegis]
MKNALQKRVRCIILYATETGKSKQFARTASEVFSLAFFAQVFCMDAYDVADLENERLVLFVSSTFGHGDPPGNGEEFAKALEELRKLEEQRKLEVQRSKRWTCDRLKPETTFSTGNGKLENLRYSVFALGSRCFPDFCAFGRYLDTMLHDLGAERITSLAEGDDIGGQEKSFRNWVQEVFKSACGIFQIGEKINARKVRNSLTEADHMWRASKFRIVSLNKANEEDLCEALSEVHHTSVHPCKLVDRIQLESSQSR